MPPQIDMRVLLILSLGCSLSTGNFLQLGNSGKYLQVGHFYCSEFKPTGWAVKRILISSQVIECVKSFSESKKLKKYVILFYFCNTSINILHVLYPLLFYTLFYLIAKVIKI